MLNKKTKAIILGTSAVIIAIAVFSGIYITSAKKTVSLWGNKVYPGVKVHGIDLSGKTKDEAMKILQESFNNPVQNKVLTIKVEDQKFQLKYEDLNPKLNVEETANKALKIGKSGSIFKENNLIKNGCNENIDLVFSYDDSKISNFEDTIKKSVNKEPVNAKVTVDNGTVSIVDGQAGKKINEEELTKAIKENINGDLNNNNEVEIAVQDIEPKVTKDKLKDINSVLGTFKSDFSSSNPGRSKNISLATNAVNGTILMPGEEFSYNDTVGERTRERGFKDAAIFVNDEVQDGLGGGICQVSTALYRAAMRAGIRSTERHNHSMPTSYSPLGLDATVAWGSLDYKFKNPYESPIYIEGIITGDKNIIFNIYGNKNDKGDKTYELVGNVVETYEPAVKEVSDQSLKEGQWKWDKTPVKGYKAQSYLITYENGNEISKEPIATDIYRKVDGVKLVGAKKEEPQAPPVEQPQAPDQPQTPEQPQAPQQPVDQNQGQNNNENNQKPNNPPSNNDQGGDKTQGNNENQQQPSVGNNQNPKQKDKK